tara:strand:+ start:2128 stop:3012 length:885 start_codon:yes stop_codon:yes gene_type:complete
MRYIILIFTFLCLIFSGTDKSKTDLPPRFDLKKGINVGKSVIPKSLNDELYPPIADYEIEKIKLKAQNWIPEPVSENDIIIFETTIGTFKGYFFNDKAPNHCLNFKKLANSGFYDGTRFHRVIPDFMIQGGDILSRDGRKSNDGTGNPGWTVDAEFNDIKHEKGILSMARSSQGENTAGSQFFICVSNQSHLDGKYTAFGKISDKMAIVDHISKVPTDKKQAIDLGVYAIPDGENIEDWVTLKLPRSRKPIYFKVPEKRKKDEYKREIMGKLRSDNPVIPVIIKKIRVVDKNKL